MRVEDLQGMNFGRLMVIERVGSDNQGRATWLCHCNCKDRRKKVVASHNLKNGAVTSCGCAKARLGFRSRGPYVKKGPVHLSLPSIPEQGDNG